MKNVILVLFTTLYLVSCGPKRMTCYGKRCVEHSASKEKMKTSKANS